MRKNRWRKRSERERPVTPMKRLIAFALAALFATSTALAEPPLRPENFANRGTINPGGAGPFYRIVLPLAVYEGLAHAGLGDLRVFNARGEAVPYAVLRNEARAVSHETETLAPIFPLLAPKAAPRGIDTTVTVRQLEDGKLVSIREAEAKPEPGEIVIGAIIDASGMKGGIRSLRLVTSDNATPFHAYSIESSRDLQHWRSLKRAQLVHLEHAGHRVDDDRAEWDGTADRYLRVLWDNPERAPLITEIRLGTVETSINMPQRIWSAELAPKSGEPGTYEYALAGQVPVERVRINFAQVNTLAPLTIQYLPEWQREGRSPWHRRREGPSRWEFLAHTVAYRLQTPEGEVRSADVAIYSVPTNHLRLVLDARGGSVGETPPTVQIGFVPHVLVFLARGEGPFTLAWGAEDVGPADLPVATLMPGYEATAPLKAAPASLGSISVTPRISAVAGGRGEPEAGSPSSKWILWAVLGVGLLVLGGMARSLSKQLRQPPK